MYDIGVLGGSEFVRFQGQLKGCSTYEHSTGQMAICPLGDFLSSFEPNLPPCPFEVGDRIHNKGDLSKDDHVVQRVHKDIREVDISPLGVDAEEFWESLTWEQAEDLYEKVRVKTAWEFLEED